MKRSLTSLVTALTLIVLAAPAAVAQDEFELTPLDGVISDMQVAGGRLSRLLTDQPTQQKQQDAIDKLDALIKVFEERRRGQGGRSGANPDRPLEDSIIKAGPGGSGPLHDANRQGRAWAQLPPRERERILQSMTEGFPPHYQRLLERYYRRLAEERPADDLPADERPAAERPGDRPAAARPAARMPEKPATE